jgi:transcriptional regulator with XRE-family HTH domain
VRNTRFQVLLGNYSAGSGAFAGNNWLKYGVRKIEEVIPMVLMRHEIGDVLRDFRLQKGKTLRDVAGKANVALGYLSEIERGQKEASSEVLQAISEALDVPLSQLLIEVGERLAVFEELTPVSSVPDTLPEEFYRDLDDHLASAKRS